ncbi:FxLD family lantipeptide [Actinomadura pelletieri DSM 43383]|uniref:FxLD family lantipeptide n=1 Tax=Actinomadura pelletieri DSM 43383 TaxID=1120940 RepID=A0A495Q9D2_9ACTN|nr:FxLD family lanthipeptide [Actinomadura pelletieri]RKS68109.1 FxLD family lantipeptide [Actinomadura pelletieri DSM 43383]
MSLSLNADAAAQPFDLDIELIEQDGIAEQVNLTDDGCNPTCPESCTSAAN